MRKSSSWLGREAVNTRGRKTPLIAAHRGSSGSAPENTLAAFQQAIDDGADMIELDVRMTKDFEIVVLHDRSVRRTTNGKGDIGNLALADLRELDAGAQFSGKFSGERIPTLRQVMNLLPPHVQLNIEVKTDGRRNRTAFEESLILHIRERNFVQRVLVSSFDHKFLRRFHKLDPEIPVGALYSPVRDIAKRPSSIARATGASAFICSIAQLRKRFADDAHASDIMLACYGVNNLRQMQKAMKFWADIVITDYPKEMRKLVARSEFPKNHRM